jgi:hypothetical protein
MPLWIRSMSLLAATKLMASSPEKTRPTNQIFLMAVDNMSADSGGPLAGDRPTIMA